MAITPQTNTTLAEIAEALKSSDNIVIAGHVGPDGDCIGSQLGLACALRQMGKTVTTTLASTAETDVNLAFMKGFDELVFAGNYKGPVDVFVAVDVPNRDRMLEAQWELHEKAKLTITIDHHAVDDRMADLSYTDPDSASTTMMVWDVANMLGVDLADVATCCYTGLLTDTGSFCNTNTDPACFKAASEMVAAGVVPGAIASRIFQSRSVASILLERPVIDRMLFGADGQFVISWITLEDFDALDAAPSDSDKMIDLLRSIKGVRVACMMREVKGPKGVFVKGSFRAKDGTDVSAIARRHTGGGHRAAAGFKMFCPLPHAVEQIMEEFETLFGSED